jgi:hypothetical protein
VTVLLQSLAIASASAFVIRIIVQQQLGKLLGEFCALPEKETVQSSSESLLNFQTPGPTGTQLKIVYSVFSYLQVLNLTVFNVYSSCSLIFPICLSSNSMSVFVHITIVFFQMQSFWLSFVSLCESPQFYAFYLFYLLHVLFIDLFFLST